LWFLVGLWALGFFLPKRLQLGPASFQGTSNSRASSYPRSVTDRLKTYGYAVQLDHVHRGRNADFSKLAADYWSEDEPRGVHGVIAANPDAGDVVPGSGGVRKVRWFRKGSGKRGWCTGDLLQSPCQR
jgi:hypothetical protein